VVGGRWSVVGGRWLLQRTTDYGQLTTDKEQISNFSEASQQSAKVENNWCKTCALVATVIDNFGECLFLSVSARCQTCVYKQVILTFFE
jgi:hypothetical protein